jgi:hypothetical protein
MIVTILILNYYYVTGKLVVKKFALIFIIVCHIESNRNLVCNNQHIYDITKQKKMQNVLTILLLCESHPLLTHGRSLAN